MCLMSPCPSTALPATEELGCLLLPGYHHCFSLAAPQTSVLEYIECWKQLQTLPYHRAAQPTGAEAGVASIPNPAPFSTAGGAGGGGGLPELQALRLSHTGLRSPSAAPFQRLRSLQVLALYMEEGLVLGDSLREYSPQMPRFICILQLNLACQCANAWLEPWLKQSTKMYIYREGHHFCPGEAAGPAKINSLFSFLWDHCPQTLELSLFFG